MGTGLICSLEDVIGLKEDEIPEAYLKEVHSLGRGTSSNRLTIRHPQAASAGKEQEVVHAIRARLTGSAEALFGRGGEQQPNVEANLEENPITIRSFNACSTKPL